MAHVSDHIHPSELTKVTRLQMLAKQVVEGFCTGLHRSPHKGSSVEFKQHRPYVHGDELRRLDWKVYGKSDRYYIREYEEETNLRCTILVDKSGSMAYRGQASKLSKHEYAVRLAASLAYLMVQQQDAVGLMTFDDRLRDHVPPRSRPAHLRAIVDALANAKPGEDTQIGAVFRTLVPKIHRRGLLLILSDCFTELDEMMRALAEFRHCRHDVAVFQIWDREELEFPFHQRTRFESLEGSEFQMLDPAHLRETYLSNLAKFREELRAGCFRHRIDLVSMVTDQPYADALAAYLAVRNG